MFLRLVPLGHTQVKLNVLHKTFNNVVCTSSSAFTSTGYPFSVFMFEKKQAQIFLANLQRFVKFMEASEEFSMTSLDALESCSKKL